ncbi:berberine bridge enzyme-like 18 [Salvia splendens]|uniref:berberine bridge enzyme-like 18 n=1 Tax=Salvia splendens TaxID=180675 RepID=UPI001100C374|nr:berberine bridge enzyme-like 18 [Salvia splendens]
MKIVTIIPTLSFILLLIFSSSSAYEHQDFLQCLSQQFNNYSSISNIVYTPNNSSYTPILRFLGQNLRFLTESTPKPQVIITPEHESQIPPLIQCAKQSGLEIRTRSGGHDFEGLSYTAQVPFVIIDLFKLSEIKVDVGTKTAWVGGGASLGSIYYRVAEKSPVLGFPAGLCPTVGVGGHFSGGGYGTLLRKYGMAGDNIIDARIVDVNGRILDRKSMGEDLFWAIRGGGGASFSVVVAWKLQLVDVPETVTVFTIDRTLEQNATELVHRWQYIAHKFDKDLLVRVLVRRVNSTDNKRNMTIQASFSSIYFGNIEKLIPLMQKSFPELGLKREDCTEVSWIQSTVYFAGFPIATPIEILLNRTVPQQIFFKGKSDYVQKPIPKHGLRGIWRLFYEAEAAMAQFAFTPYGGRMAEISSSAIPYPHRGENLFSVVYWQIYDGRNPGRYIGWLRRLYDYMAPYVSKNPRAAYVNYRDLDIGVNNVVGETSYKQASVWGKKYFGGNFDRLVRVKTAVDPQNFFRNEQSIPVAKI